MVFSKKKVFTSISSLISLFFSQNQGVLPKSGCLFLFAVIMNRLTDEVRREPPWTMLFADDIVIGEETREEVERRLESRKYALKRKGMKVSRSKT